MLIEFRMIFGAGECVYRKKNDIETEFQSFCLFLFN